MDLRPFIVGALASWTGFTIGRSAGTENVGSWSLMFIGAAAVAVGLLLGTYLWFTGRGALRQEASQ